MESHRLLRRSLIAAAMVMVLGFGTAAEAQRPNTTTAVTTKQMCPNCAKKIAARLYTIRGVKDVRVNVQQKTLLVTPQTNVVLSPRALWETVKNNGEQPVRLAGPSGTFTETPRF